MTLRLLALAALAGVAGAVAGLLTAGPSTAQTPVSVELTVNPGGQLMEPNTGWLTCGWHSQCDFPYPFGSGLDWDAYDNGPVTWRSWGIRHDIYTSQIADTYVRVRDTATCYQIELEVRDIFGPYLGSEYYEHVTTAWPNWWNPVSGGAGYWVYTEFQIGTAPGVEKSIYCPFGGSHVHQYSPNMSYNAGYPTGQQHNIDQHGILPYPIRDFGYWQNYRQWCWSC